MNLIITKFTNLRKHLLFLYKKPQKNGLVTLFSLLLICSSNFAQAATIQYEVHLNLVSFASDNGSDAAVDEAKARRYVDLMNTYSFNPSWASFPEYSFNHYGFNLIIDSYSTINDSSYNSSTASGYVNSKVLSSGKVQSGAITMWFNKGVNDTAGSSWGPTISIAHGYTDPNTPSARHTGRHEIGHSLGLQHSNFNSYLSPGITPHHFFTEDQLTTMKNSSYSNSVGAPEPSSLLLTFLSFSTMIFRRCR